MPYIAGASDAEVEAGCRSSWNLVPKRYEVADATVSDLRARGFEVGVHGLYHDGRDLESHEDAAKLDAMEKAGKLKRIAFADRAQMKKLVDPVIEAYAKDVGAEQIVQLDHLRAFGDPGQHRGRDQVAAEGGDRVRRRRPLPLQQGGELGEAATALLGRDLVHVVGVQHRDPHRLGERGAPEQQDQCRTRAKAEPTPWK